MKYRLNFNNLFKGTNDLSTINIVEQSDDFETGGYVLKIPITNTENGCGINLPEGSVPSDSLAENQSEMNSLLCISHSISSVTYLSASKNIQLTIPAGEYFDGDVLFPVGSFVEVAGVEAPDGDVVLNSRPLPNGSFIVSSCEKVDTNHIVKFKFKTDYDEDKTFTGTAVCSGNDTRTFISLLVAGLYNQYKKLSPAEKSDTLKINKELRLVNRADSISEIYTFTFNKKIKKSSNNNF